MFQRAFLAALAALPFITEPTTAQSCLECSGTVWYVDSSSAGGNGLSWANAFPTLTEAVAAASSGDCIWVAAGRYFPSATNDRSESFVINKSLKLYGGFDGSETCFADRAGNFSGTRLSGEIGNPNVASDNSYLVVDITFSVSATIDGFTIRDAYNDGGIGGGIRKDVGGILRLDNCIIRNNRAGSGAGLYSEGSRFHIVRSKFIANVAKGVTDPTAGSGGAIWAGGPGNDCNVHNVEFRNNEAGDRGGVFYFQGFGIPPAERRVIIANGLFHGNSAPLGGVGCVAEDNFSIPLLPIPRGIAELVNCTLSDNSATTGSALFAEETALPVSLHPGEFHLQNCIVWGNVGPSVISATELTNGNSTIDFSIVEPAASYWDCSGGLCINQTLCNRFACDPLFSGTTFRLGSGSPAIDSGDSTAVALPNDFFDLDGDGNTTEDLPLDLDLRPRVQGSEIDRGCYEK